jgi:translation elongation factor P/translation initiation factor 5A
MSRVVQVVEDEKVVEVEELREDSYILVCGEQCELAHRQVFSNGTHQLTIKVDLPGKAS